MNIKEEYGVNNIDPNDIQQEEPSRADIPATYEDTIRHNAFKSPMPLDAILEGIENQFDDYIGTEDRQDYVDMFYDALAESYKVANDDTELFQEDVIHVLNEIQDKFTDKLVELFKTRLTLTISDIESDSYDQDDIEFIIRKLYEFFILNAKNNFKVTIAADIKQRLGIIKDSREYFKNLRALLIHYSPLITTFGPMEFLKYRGDQDIIEFFNDGKVVGNFLRKYSPKLYQNEEFEVELINYITMVQQINQEVFNNER